MRGILPIKQGANWGIRSSSRWFRDRSTSCKWVSRWVRQGKWAGAKVKSLLERFRKSKGRERGNRAGNRESRDLVERETPETFRIWSREEEPGEKRVDARILPPYQVYLFLCIVSILPTFKSTKLSFSLIASHSTSSPFQLISLLATSSLTSTLDPLTPLANTPIPSSLNLFFLKFN